MRERKRRSEGKPVEDEERVLQTPTDDAGTDQTADPEHTPPRSLRRRDTTRSLGSEVTGQKDVSLFLFLSVAWDDKKKIPPLSGPTTTMTDPTGGDGEPGAGQWEKRINPPAVTTVGGKAWLKLTSLKTCEIYTIQEKDTDLFLFFLICISDPGTRVWSRFFLTNCGRALCDGDEGRVARVEPWGRVHRQFARWRRGRRWCDAHTQMDGFMFWRRLLIQSRAIPKLEKFNEWFIRGLFCS